MPREVRASGEVTRNHILSIFLLLKKKKKNPGLMLRGQPGPWIIQGSGQKLICKTTKQIISFLHPLGLADSRENPELNLNF